jgi:hypothetical protein
MMQASENRGGGKDRGQARAQNRDDRGQTARAERGNGNGNSKGNSTAGNPGRGNNDRTVVVDRRGNDELRRGRFDDDVRIGDAFAVNSRGLVDGCPPGLAAKNNGCRPPGQAKKEDGVWQNSLYRPDWWGLSNVGDGRYLYDDGYLYRLNNAGTVAGFIPLLGGALGVGNPWPSFYEPVPLPSYYQNYFGLGPSNSYRYADDVIYRVDPETAAITSIAALLTGDQFTVGQPMPLGYDVYNVPYAYRDQYFDSPDSMYRYSDGYVYQVDPETRLIAAAIELLT